MDLKYSIARDNQEITQTFIILDYLWVISGLSVAYQWVISGLSPEKRRKKGDFAPLHGSDLFNEDEA